MIQQKLEQLGIQVQGGIENLGEETYFQELNTFIKGMDFMKIGQAASRKQWSSAMMTLRRMTQKGNELGMKNMEMLFLRLRKEIGEKNIVAVKNSSLTDTETSANHKDFAGRGIRNENFCGRRCLSGYLYYRKSGGGI